MEVRKTFLLVSLLYSSFVYSRVNREEASYTLPLLQYAKQQIESTSPIIANMPDWIKATYSDREVLFNPALLSMRNENVINWQSLSMQLKNSGDIYGMTDGYEDRFQTLGALQDALENADVTTPQYSQMFLSSEIYRKNMAFMFSKVNSRQTQLSDEKLYFESYKDYTFQLSTGGQVFNTPELGNFSVGVNMKAIYRKGDEYEESLSDFEATQKISQADLAKTAVGLGLDYSLLYSLPKNLTSKWLFQFGILWKNLGTTQFYGNSTSRGARFSYLPNDIKFGSGFCTPSFWRGTKASMQLEYSGLGSPRTLSQRIKIASEIRLNHLLQIIAGSTISGAYSAGLGFRFSQVETNLVSYSQWLDYNSNKSQRLYALEVRHVL